jgi:hypothetical protein
MRAFAALTLATLSACASSNSPTPNTRAQESIRVASQAGGSATMRINPSVTTSTLALPVTLDRVWAVLPEAYDSVGVAISDMDPRRHVIGNSGFSVRRRLGKTMLSRYLDCGSSQLGPSADEYQITMSVMSSVQPRGASDSTVVTTNVDASAQGLQFSGQTVRCTSRGELEKQLHAMVTQLIR